MCVWTHRHTQTSTQARTHTAELLNQQGGGERERHACGSQSKSDFEILNEDEKAELSLTIKT